jgi:hypothetical protein
MIIAADVFQFSFSEQNLVIALNTRGFARTFFRFFTHSVMKYRTP